MMSSPNMTVKSPALLFTDAGGQVVFVDPSFLRMMHYSEAGMVAGEPLHKALGLEQKLAKQLMDDLRKLGQVSERQYELRNMKGAALQVAFTGIATYDESGTFIGADITLRDMKRDTTEIKVLGRGDVIKARMQQMIEDSVSNEDAIYLQFYFTAQMEALHILLVRLLGMWAQAELDQVMNSRTEEQGWGVRFRDGLFHVVMNDTSPYVYQTLLHDAIGYAASMIGLRVVAREMQAVDEHMDARCLELAHAAGLLGLYNS